jgi:hypothetical protein
MKRSIMQIAFHRNGVSGVPFYAIQFHDSETGNALATVFPEAGVVAVISIDRLPGAGVTFGENSWRGDHFEPWLREQIARYMDEIERTAGIGL